MAPSWLVCTFRDKDDAQGGENPLLSWWRNLFPAAKGSGASGNDGIEDPDAQLEHNREILRRSIPRDGEPKLVVYCVQDFPERQESQKPRAFNVPANAANPIKLSTENFEGEGIVLNRRASGWESPQDRYGGYFSGRRRLWELRIQGRFRRIPKNDLFVGIVLRDFNYDQAVESSSKYVKNMGMKLVKYDLYIHWGDREEASKLPDAELSHMVTDMAGWDQIIVTPKGESPPRINGDLTGLGFERKAEGLKEFVKKVQSELQNVNLETTYTFCFWGPSQILDVLRWQFDFGFGIRVPMYRFFEEWPIHAVMYELDRSEFTKEDQRHLERRKRYYLDFMLWSSTISEIQDNQELLSAYRFAGPPGGPDGSNGHLIQLDLPVQAVTGEDSITFHTPMSRQGNSWRLGTLRRGSRSTTSCFSCLPERPPQGRPS